MFVSLGKDNVRVKQRQKYNFTLFFCKSVIPCTDVLDKTLKSLKFRAQELNFFQQFLAIVFIIVCLYMYHKFIVQMLRTIIVLNNIQTNSILFNYNAGMKSQTNIKETNGCTTWYLHDLSEIADIRQD